MANAYSLLQESESELTAVSVGELASVSFFQDFAKDTTRSCGRTGQSGGCGQGGKERDLR